MKHTILIVDDEKFNRQIILDILMRVEEGYSVLSAVSGKIGCELAEKFLPDLILMDWMMPEMTGLEALIRLKAQQKTKHIPVIMVTGVTVPAWSPCPTAMASVAILPSNIGVAFANPALSIARLTILVLSLGNHAAFFLFCFCGAARECNRLRMFLRALGSLIR